MWQIVLNDEICGEVEIVQGPNIWWMDTLSFVDHSYTTHHENEKKVTTCDYLWLEC
jgi:hypothetical protein